MMSTRRISIWLVAGALALQGCSTSTSSRKKSPSGKPPSADASTGISPGEPLGEASPQEVKDFQEIEALQNKGLYDSAESKMNYFAKRHPKSNLLPAVENLHGLLLLKLKKPEQAITRFQKAIRINPNNRNFNQYILYNLAIAQTEANQSDEAQNTLNQIQLSVLDKNNKLKVYYLKATLYQRKSLPLEASRQLLAAGRLLNDTDMMESKKAFYKSLDQSLQGINDISSLEKLYQEYEDSPVSDAVLFRLGSQELTIGNHGNSEIHLRTLLQKFPNSPYYSQASERVNTAKNQTSVESRSIGVLLPTKGKFGKFGLKSIQGIQLALGIFDPKEPDSQINIVVEDSGDEPDQAIKAMNRLVFKHHVVAIIGPMLSKGVDQISQRAQELGVPLISISRKSSQNEDYVFQAGLTHQLQAYGIADYAVKKLGIKRFAMIYPNEKFGIEISQSFWEAIESMGGKIVGAEHYNPGETDFRQVVDRLSGLYYAEARQRELDLLAQEREANHITKRTRRNEQFFRLKPIVDYDAVFIPDEPRVAGQILPTFAYRDVEHVKFLGTSAWDAPEFITRTQPYAEHATFVDAYFPDSKSQTVRNFAEKFKTQFGQEPTAFEAIAYDAANLLKYVLSSSHNLTRSDVRDRLKEVRDFTGVTGKMNYKDGQFFRDLRVITVKNGKFVEAPQK
jgi:ABC-type branched-subunit amino acid transport system substrate-binding protein